MLRVYYHELAIVMSPLVFSKERCTEMGDCHGDNKHRSYEKLGCSLREKCIYIWTFYGIRQI